MQSANLAEQETCNGPYHHTDCVAELELTNLGECFAVTDQDDGDVQEQLDCLEDQYEIPSPATVDPEGEVGKCTNGILVGVEVCRAISITQGLGAVGKYALMKQCQSRVPDIAAITPKTVYNPTEGLLIGQSETLL